MSHESVRNKHATHCFPASSSNSSSPHQNLATCAPESHSTLPTKLTPTNTP
eukprot:CAMPEP_0184723888 /NCGR_PEP_ID=MMETSP0314-20130426/26452_1 /TAXON_ID=38298 /ORGANISM="Rhodella maculata, Strain CCMP 736" /LENGTH=50 /DNA_ID=CAMNT_0027188771 /DNA_START=44 /DNA_END=193 /DNA_ORIENTATION=-